MEQQEQIDWRDNIQEPKVLKIAPNTEATFTFLDEGTLKENEDYGASIAFRIKTENSDDEKIFYVKANNFTFLGQIKGLGTLKDLKVKVSRKGSKRSDTRYTIEKL